MKYYTTEPGQYPEQNKDNSNEFFGNGWSVKEESNKKFTLDYISGSLQGSSKSFQISESDYIDAKQGKLTLDDLCIKYNIY